MMLSNLLVFLILATSVNAFTSRFFYGCDATHCSYRFEVEESAAQFINETALSIEVATLNNLTNLLYNSSTTMDSSQVAQFSEAFNKQYSITKSQVDQISQSVNDSAPCFKSSNDLSSQLADNSVQLNVIANCLIYASNSDAQTNCFLLNNVPGDVGLPQTNCPSPSSPSPKTQPRSDFELFDY